MNQITADILNYYQNHQRDLPWRGVNNPYYTWLSEIMLQQTRVEAVKGYFARFIAALPSVEDLAQADSELLLKLWQGLGYYTRVHNLQKAACRIMTDYGGHLPSSKKELLKLAGIGDYTASAIASICFGQNEVALDGNLIRVFSRLFALKDDFTKQAAKKALIQRIEGLLPEGRAGDFNQAVMDIGATICIPNGKPLCRKCPLSKYCLAKKADRVMDYPLRKEKKARRVEPKTLFILTKKENHQMEVLLRKRQDKGVLRGLWEFPSAEGHLKTGEVREIIENEFLGLDNQIDFIQELMPARHIFTHLEWDMKAYWIALKSSRQSAKTPPGGFINHSQVENTESLIEEKQKNYHFWQIPDNKWTEIGFWADKRQIKEELSLPSAFKNYEQFCLESL